MPPISRPFLLFAYGTAAVLWIVASQASAQITLRSNANQFIPGQRNFDESSRNQREEYPVSRGVLPSPIPLGNFNVPGNEGGASSDATRQSEYETLVSESIALERQLGLIRRIVKFASPSIVHIEATKKSESGKGLANSRIEEAGAGIIVDLFGSHYVITNRHVVYPADLNSIRFELADGTTLRPTKIWTDSSTDVAVLNLGRNDLVTAKLGDSDQMEIGDFVLAVGSPFGLSHSVSYGIISAKGRRNLELGSKGIEIQDFFQTDAAINPGNSGGPLINLRGEIIGINTAIASNSGGSEGIGFTIPINMAVQVAEQLISKGSMRKSYLGVQLENTFDALTAAKLGLKSSRGALVKSILPNSPASNAGLKVGDVILEINGRPVDNDGHLVKMVGLTPSGSQAELLIYREGGTRRVLTVLEASPQ